MKTPTKFDHFIENYIVTFLFLICTGCITFITEIVRGSNTYYFSIFFFIIAFIILPIGNSISWNKKFKRK